MSMAPDSPASFEERGEFDYWVNTLRIDPEDRLR
jgi:hypothetical protein